MILTPGPRRRHVIPPDRVVIVDKDAEELVTLTNPQSTTEDEEVFELSKEQRDGVADEDRRNVAVMLLVTRSI